MRDKVIPVTSVVLNLLSVGAAYGVVVALFQWGWGLSMDYHVFILSRIRESYDRTGDSDQAVAHGIKVSARHDEAARPVQLVPAPVAAVAAADRPRFTSGAEWPTLGS